MGQMRQEPELIDKEIHIPFICGSAKSFFDGQVNQQTIDRHQNRSDPEIIFDEYDLPALVSDNLAQRNRSPLRKISDKYFADHLLKFRNNPQSLAGFFIFDVRQHGLEI